MAEFPFLPLWTDALLGDVQHLSQAEFGAYLLMLIAAWRTPSCSLPADDKFLARITRSDRNWKRIRVAVMPFWTLGADGQLRQKRLTYEALAAAEVKAQKRAAGKSSALKKKERLQAGVAKVLSTPLQRQANYPHPSPSSRKKDPESLDSGAAAPGEISTADPTPKSWLYNEGISYLRGATDKTDKAARSLIGRWCKNRTDADVLAAIHRAIDIKALDPIGYITKILQNQVADQANAATDADGRPRYVTGGL